jgi:hypothetical protein
MVTGNATTTGSLWVSDIATLATTTMRYGTKIGDNGFNSSITFTATNLNDTTPLGVNSMPLIRFQNNSTALNNSLGFIEHGVIVTENSTGNDWPQIGLGSHDILEIVGGSSMSMLYSTTSDILVMTSSRIVIDTGDTLSAGNHLGSFSTAGLNLYKDNAAASDIIFAITTSTDQNLTTFNTKFKILADGSYQADGALLAGHADYAEYFKTKDNDLTAGQAVCVDILNNDSIERCTRGSDPNIMGIVSTNPAIIGNAPDDQDRSVGYAIIAMLGQIPAKVSAENGPIRPGDSLTSAASIPGYIMKANAGDSTVGVALEGLESGTGTIQVLISRRNQSLTVEQVEEKITQHIAEMEIEDEVNIMVASAINNLNLDGEIAANLDPKLLLLDAKYNLKFSAVDSALESLHQTADAQELKMDELTDRVASFATTASSTQVALLGLSSRTEILENSFTQLEQLASSQQEFINSASSTLVILATKVDELYTLMNNAGAGALTVNTSSPLMLDKLAVSQAAEFYGTMTVYGEAGFMSRVTFEREVEFKDHLTVDKDTAGTIIIPVGATSTEVIFEREYQLIPKVVVSINKLKKLSYAVIEKTVKGFRVAVDPPADEALEFDWIALAANGQVAGAQEQKIFGCLDSAALNFSALANQDDGSCLYAAMIPVINPEPQLPLPVVESNQTADNGGSEPATAEVSTTAEPTEPAAPTETASENPPASEPPVASIEAPLAAPASGPEVTQASN